VLALGDTLCGLTPSPFGAGWNRFKISLHYTGRFRAIEWSKGSRVSMPDIVQLPLNGRRVKPHKCVISPLLGTRTVLTNSPWGFVALWLKRERKNDALFFWNQAQEFHTASEGMSLESAPLLHYYCFMNATKALLVAKGLPFDPHHGVKGTRLRDAPFCC
jgi:hypothetical protein